MKAMKPHEIETFKDLAAHLISLLIIGFIMAIGLGLGIKFIDWVFKLFGG